MGMLDRDLGIWVGAQERGWSGNLDLVAVSSRSNGK